MASYEKPDFWSLKAQKENYPARSVYKLEEIDKKFNIFKSVVQKNFRILDLGAAPGSWSLYTLRHYKKIFLSAVDLLPLSRNFDSLDQKNFFFIQGDFFDNTVREVLISRGPYNVIMSDAAPGTTGSRTVDTLRSMALAEAALSYAENCLVPGGNLVFKVFQGADTAELLKNLREHFTSAKSFKPAACRSASFETYYIGLEKKALDSYNA